MANELLGGAPREAQPASATARRMAVVLEKGSGPPVVSYKKLCKQFEPAGGSAPPAPAPRAPAADAAAAGAPAVGAPSAPLPGAPAVPSLPSAEAAMPTEGGTRGGEAGEDLSGEELSDDDKAAGPAGSDEDGSDASQGGGKEIDWYDVDDDFIDDTELQEAELVDSRRTKHSGFYVNKGQLERDGELPAEVHFQKTKKRKLADMSGVGKVRNAQEAGLPEDRRLQQPADPQMSLFAGSPLSASQPATEAVRQRRTVEYEPPPQLEPLLANLRQCIQRAPAPTDGKRRILSSQMSGCIEAVGKLFEGQNLPRGLVMYLMKDLEGYTSVPTLKKKLKDSSGPVPSTAAGAASSPLVITGVASGGAAPASMPQGVPAAPPAAAAATPSLAARFGQAPPGTLATAAGASAVTTEAFGVWVRARQEELAQARAASGALGGGDPEFSAPQELFKWNSDGEELLYAVVQSVLRENPNGASNIYNMLVKRFWPTGGMEGKLLKERYKMVKLRKKAASKPPKATPAAAPAAVPAVAQPAPFAASPQL